jgi:hypothetical protein
MRGAEGTVDERACQVRPHFDYSRPTGPSKRGEHSAGPRHTRGKCRPYSRSLIAVELGAPPLGSRLGLTSHFIANDKRPECLQRHLKPATHFNKCARTRGTIQTPTELTLRPIHLIQQRLEVCAK